MSHSHLSPLICMRLRIVLSFSPLGEHQPHPQWSQYPPLRPLLPSALGTWQGFVCFFFFPTEVQLAYNIVLVLDVQQSDSVMHMHMYIYIFSILFHYNLL